jgi:hypothetical protein
MTCLAKEDDLSEVEVEDDPPTPGWWSSLRIMEDPGR